MDKKERPEPLRECCRCEQLFYCEKAKYQIHSEKPCLFFKERKNEETIC